MKVLAILLLCLLAASASVEVQEVSPVLAIHETDENGVKEVATIVGGILVGAFTHHTSILQCYRDSKSLFTHFTSAFNSLRKETLPGVKAGLVSLGQAFKDIPTAIKDCKDVANIIKKLRNLAVYFSNPSLLAVNAGKNIIWHARSIYKEVKAIVYAYQHKNWFSFGLNIGIIVDMVFLSNPKFAQQLGNEGMDFFEGFAHGLNPTFYDDMQQCIHDVSPQSLERIINDIKDLDWKHIDRSVHDIQDIVQLFIATVKDCQTSSQDFANFLERLTHALDIGNFTEAALKIITNPLKFFRMVQNIQGDVSKHDFFDAGDIIGDFVGDVLKLHSTAVEELIKA